MAKRVKFGASGKPNVSATRRTPGKARKKASAGGASGSGGGKGGYKPGSIIDW